MQVSDEMVRAGAFALCESMGIDPEKPFRDHRGREMDFPEWHRWQADVRAAITAALAAMWRPIGDGDDASRSGQRALVTGGGLDGEVEVAKYNSRIGCWEAETCTLDDRDDEVDGYSKPTHFMPLPSPPKAEG